MDSPTPRRGPGQLHPAAVREALLTDLHARVIQADPEALERLAQEILPFLRQRLRKRFPSAAEDLIVDAVEDAFLEYARHPNRFDTCEGRFDRLLLHAGRRNLLNLLESERRRRARETKYFQNGSRMVSGEGTSSTRLDSDTLRWILSAAADDREREAIRRWLDEDRATASLAIALGLSERTPSEQRKGVKRFKDRIIKRLRRQSVKKVNG